jgi:hypothetical protein
VPAGPSETYIVTLGAKRQAPCPSAPPRYEIWVEMRAKDCVRAENRSRFDKRSCPSLLTRFRRQASDGCVLCLQCAKVCPYENMGWRLVTSEAPVRQKALLRPCEYGSIVCYHFDNLGVLIASLALQPADHEALWDFGGSCASACRTLHD